jgi:cystathionine gamma-synthase
MPDLKPETVAVHAARTPDPATGAVAPPLHLSTTFERAPDGSYPHGFQYGRSGNPTRDALERAIAALEVAADALCFASGTAASMAAFSLLRPGDHVVVPTECYYGTLRQLRLLVETMGVDVTQADTSDLDALRAACTPTTRMLWIETPSNPRLRIADITGAAEMARARGALLACDSTFATPVLQQPLALGADVVMHSTTKFLAGHSDVTGGALAVREAGDVLDRLREYQHQAGAVPAPFDCWMIRRSIMTLPLRVRAQSATALQVARFLAQHPGVDAVHYPGLESHPGHAVAVRQMAGFGSMLSFEVPGGAPAAMRVAGRVRLFTRATSLGSVESLIEHRASIEGPQTTTPDGLLRLSIGLEHPDDLIADLAQALT